MRWNMLLRCKSIQFVGLLVFCGCAHVNDPWRDSSVAINDDMRTPSSEDYSKGNRAEFRTEYQRPCGTSQVAYHNGSVTHWPLWFEDPFEDRGNTDVPMRNPDQQRDMPDNQFAVNWVDYFHIAYGPAREFVNIIGWPVSAVVTPPGTLMESDGRIGKGLLGYDHDAKRSDSVTREPPDVAMLAPPFSHLEKAPTTNSGSDADH
jgi:hypothetical protein